MDHVPTGTTREMDIIIGGPNRTTFNHMFKWTKGILLLKKTTSMS